jgi:hypothetical protein
MNAEGFFAEAKRLNLRHLRAHRARREAGRGRSQPRD